MLRILAVVLLLGVGAAQAQTTLDITLPGGTTCSYATGPVTSGSVAGHLQANATSSSGSGCASGATGVSFGPASLLAPASTNLGGSTGTVNFTFQALNATNCTGSITGAVGGAFNSGPTLCTGTGCAGLVQAPATFTNLLTTAATYTVGVVCTGPSGSAPTSATVVAGPAGSGGGGSCGTVPNSGGNPATFTRWTGNHSINFSSGGSKVADVTSFDSLYGTFPGNPGASLYIPIPQYNFMSLKFTPAPGFITGLPTGSYGDFTFNEGTSGWGTQVAVTISTSCGDFSDPSVFGSASTVVPGCYEPADFSGSVMQWRAHDGNCVLQDGQTYYFNVIPATLTNVTPTGGGSASSNAALSKYKKCTSGICSTPIQNGPQCRATGGTPACVAF